MDNKQLQESHSIIARTWVGPIPPPEVIGEYNNIVPGSAEKIIEQALSQTSHRISIEKYMIKHNVRRAYWGQIYGFIIAFFGLSLGGFLIYKGHDFAGAILAGVTLCGMVTVFVIGREQRQKDVQEKSPRQNFN